MTESTTPIEQKIVFAAGAGEAGPMILMGIPAGAWDYMKDGRVHHFDLGPVGIPVRLMLFGGASHDACMALLQQALARSGSAYLDLRREDFGIRPPAPEGRR